MSTEKIYISWKHTFIFLWMLIWRSALFLFIWAGFIFFIGFLVLKLYPGLDIVFAILIQIGAIVINIFMLRLALTRFVDKYTKNDIADLK